MRLPYAIVAFFTSLCHAIPDALSDFANLAALISTTAKEVTSSMNYPSIANASSAMNTTFALPVGLPYPTAMNIQNICSVIDASRSDCAANSTAFINGQAMNTLDDGYMGYINQIPTLSQALVARGRAWHPEWNSPVYNAIDRLAQAVYAYGTQLTQSDVISLESTVRTLSAGGTLIDAQAAWNQVGTLPGRKT